MRKRIFRAVILFALAAVFTAGLTFATVELPYRMDSLLQRGIHTPGFDSQADGTSRLKTELFIDHYNIRIIGYTAFFLLLLLIAVGFARRRSGLAAAGAVAFMLPVFAQFAGVMFFLAGLGVLNALWLPLLDISFRLQELGSVIHAPYGLLMWLGGLAGFNAYWYIVYFFIAAGLLVFFVGTYSWLSARAGGGRKVADHWIYRYSRHPQYAGWIMWSYGMYLLLLLQRYPKRSWGISGSLPWLVSTIFIIGVAMVEELRMLQQAGDSYRRYRESAPMLFPMPKVVRRFFSLPLKLVFRKDLPERTREVVGVLAVYTVILLSCSYLFYMGGADRIESALSGDSSREATMAGIAGEIVATENWRLKYHLAGKLAAYGEEATGQLTGLLSSDQENVRVAALEALWKTAPLEAAEPVAALLGDQSDNVRWKAAGTLGRIISAHRGESIGEGSSNGDEGGTGLEAEAAFLLEALEGPLAGLLDSYKGYIVVEAMRALAYLGSDTVIARARDLIDSEDKWFRSGVIDVLGISASMASGEKLAAAVELLTKGLDDPEPMIRRASVLAILRSGSDLACDRLERARQDEDWEVRVYATEAARRLCD